MADSSVLRGAGYSRPVYYGWWVLAATALTEMLAIGSTSYAAGLFVLRFSMISACRGPTPTARSRSCSLVGR